MNTVQDAINHLRKKKLTYWLVKTTSGKLKGEYEGDDLEDSLQEFDDLSKHLITGKYELTVRSGKQNYRGATVFDFEVYNNGIQQQAAPQNAQNTSMMDTQFISILIDIRTSLKVIEMKLEQQDREQDRKFKELGKALADVFDEKEEKPQLSPLEMIQGMKGLTGSLDSLKM